MNISCLWFGLTKMEQGRLKNSIQWMIRFVLSAGLQTDQCWISMVKHKVSTAYHDEMLVISMLSVPLGLQIPSGSVLSPSYFELFSSDT